jgi:hypothetical protein
VKSVKVFDKPEGIVNVAVMDLKVKSPGAKSTEARKVLAKVSVVPRSMACAVGTGAGAVAAAKDTEPVGWFTGRLIEPVSHQSA